MDYNYLYFMITFSIIIPAKNERNNLERLLPLLTKLYPASPIWIVDDNSKDKTEEFIKEFNKKHKQVGLIVRMDKRGRGSAVIEGFKEAIKNKEISYFLEMDADCSHNPVEIDSIITQAKDDTIVIGSRHIKGSKFVCCSKARILISRLANLYIKSVLRIPINDFTNGFRLYPRRAIDVLKESIIHEQGFIMLSETAYILYLKGFTFREVSTVFVNRKIGKSNITIREILHSLPAIFKIRFSYTF